MTIRRVVPILLSAVLLALIVTPAQTANALPLTTKPRILMLGDSLAWQMCHGQVQEFNPVMSGLALARRDGGCHGWAGATVADMAFEVQGGRFFSNGPGQPHPYFPNRGMRDVWNVREAIDRADAIVIGLGTNEAGRWVNGCGASGKYTPWPVQIRNARGTGPNPPPCKVTPAAFGQHIDYFCWLAGWNTPVFWIDVATLPAGPSQDLFNAEIYKAAQRNKNLHVLRWTDKSRKHPEYFYDGVHLTDPGRDARFSLIRTGLRGQGLLP